MGAGVRGMTRGVSTLSRWCSLVTLFLPATLLVASVTSTNRSGLPLGAVATSLKELPGSDASPGGEDWGLGRGREESEAVASGPGMSRSDTVGWNGSEGPGEGGRGGESVGRGGTVDCSAEGNSLAECQEAQRVRSRPRRSLTFPEGSKASLRVNLKYLLFNNSNWLAYANGFRSHWELPKNGTVALPFARSIQRREIFRDVEEIMIYHGIDGRACILRGLCEATESLAAGSGIVKRLLHLLFTIPEGEEHHLEEYSPQESGWKMKGEETVETRNSTDCGFIFSSCPFSLLDMQSYDADESI